MTTVYTNRYEIVRHLARGGMAEVYLAHDRLLDRKVALKVLFPEFARDPSFVQRFRREAQAAANLNHPNIVAVYDWGEEDGTYFIVMEFVEGETLREFIRANVRLGDEQAADIAADVAAALSFAHRGGVIHRDVKPGNILITPNGQVKVTDFGIARAGGSSEGLTQTGSVMGTATYFSPEQAQGLPVDARSDVYALGVVLYEMVSGVPPFSGDSPVAIAYKHVREEPVPPRRHNPDVDAKLEQIITVAMAKSPADRYASADDLRDDLVRFRRGQPVGAVPVTALVAEVPEAATAAMAVTRVGDQTAIGVPPLVPAPPKRTAAFVITLFLLVALVVGLLVLLGRQLSSGGTAQVSVPPVTNKTLTEARDLLELANLKADPEFVQNDKFPDQEVFKQDPPPGTKLKRGESVKLTVSQGPGTVKIPDVINESQSDAVSKLQDAGLQTRVVNEPNDRIAENLVVSTEPPPDTLVAKGSTVVVHVSSGVAKAAVPDVTGLDPVDAAAQLGSAGFRVQQLSESSTAVAKGKVTRTDPAGGTQAPKNSTVRMYVSSGAEQVPVPDVVGKTESDARNALTAAGFQAQSSQVTCSRLENDGKVIAQNPTGGSSAAKGSTVDITVCHFGGSGGTTTTT